MRIYYAGDVHGSEKCWRKFLNAAKFYEVDTLILGGDITGKVMVPVVATADGRHQARVLGRDEVVADDGLDELEKRIRFNGFYPYRCDRGEYERLERDTAHREAVFTQLMVDEVRRWIRLAEERLEGTGINCLVMPGNDDELAVDEALESSYVVNPDGRVVELDGLQILSSCWTNPTPWNSPREESEEQLRARFAALAARLDPGLPAIFNLHCPPINTQLDRAPLLDGRPAGGARRRRAAHRLGRLGRRARADRALPAAGLAARPHPRVPRHCEDRQDHVCQSRQRLLRGCHRRRRRGAAKGQGQGVSTGNGIGRYPMATESPPVGGGGPQVFARNATGLRREARARDVFIYNTNNQNVGIGVTFMVLLIPAFYAGGNMLVATLLAGLLALPMACVYAYFAAAMPRSGGDYVYIGRTLHPFLGFLASWNWVIWLITYTGIPAAYLAQYGLSGLFRELGYVFDSPPWSATATTSPASGGSSSPARSS